MTIVKNIRCNRTLDENGKDRITIAWDEYVPDVTDVIGFSVYRSKDLETFEKIKQGITQTFYQDIDADIFPGVDYYYKVTYITASGESSLTDAESTNLYHDKNTVTGYGENLYYILEETVRRCGIGFQQLGESCKIYLRKRVGDKCPKCYDPLSRRSPDPRCPECWGTGIVGGYDSYTIQMIVYEAPIEMLPMTPFGRQIDYAPSAVLTNYPMVHEKDLFKRQDGRAYRISNVTPFYMQNFLIEQQFKIALVEDTGDVAYLLDT